MKALIPAAIFVIGTAVLMAHPATGQTRSASVKPATLEDVQRAVAPVNVLRGNFVQVKQVKGFTRPLRSNGTFLVSKVEGVQWNTIAPFRGSTVITPKGIITRSASGQVTTVGDASKQPAVRAVNDMLVGVMGGNFSLLQNQFAVTVTSVTDKGWAMTLKPRSAGLRRVVSQIDLQGDRYVREVQMTEAAGDLTQWSFANLSVSPSSLSASERNGFLGR